MDIRLNVDFFQHPKAVKLERRLGFAGVKGLLCLWTWAAKNRPTGDLSGLTDEDVEIAAGWSATSEQTAFVPVLVEVGFLDETDTGYVLHEWAQHNPWVAGAPDRSDQNRFTRMAATCPEVYDEMAAQGVTSITREEYVKVVQEFNARRRNVNVTSTPEPDPENLLVKSGLDPQVTHNVSTDLSTDLSTPLPEMPPSGNGAKGPDREALLQVFLKFYRVFPGYRPSPPDAERAWAATMLRYLVGLDLHEEFGKAVDWVKRKAFRVRDSRAFLVKWFKRVQKERRASSLA